MYLDEMRDLLEMRCGIQVNDSTIWKALKHSGLTRKKVCVLIFSLFFVWSTNIAHPGCFGEKRGQALTLPIPIWIPIYSRTNCICWWELIWLTNFYLREGMGTIWASLSMVVRLWRASHTRSRVFGCHFPHTCHQINFRNWQGVMASVLYCPPPKSSGLHWTLPLRVENTQLDSPQSSGLWTYNIYP